MARHFRKKNDSKKQIKLPVPSLVTIQNLGVKGDGIGRSENGDLFFVQYALTGEQVIAKPIKKKGDGYSCFVVEIVQASVNRVEPSCKHFTECGGCKLQHMNYEYQKEFKKNIIQGAFKKQDIEAPIKDTVVANGLRRRARFVVKKSGKNYVGGFHKPQSHSIAPISSCEIVSPVVWNAFQSVLQSLSRFKAPNALDIHVTEGTNGVEIVIYPHGDFDIELDAREVLTEITNEHKFVGLYWFSKDFIDPVCVMESLKVKFGDVLVGIPPASFLQPSKQGQDVVTNLILDSLDGVKGRVADLFSGSGCFSFPLTKFGNVDAFEGNAAAINLLNKTASAKGVHGFIRDLDFEPLEIEECDSYKAIVLNPPRTGALSQVEQLAGSKCPMVVYVSCNPISLARDCSVLTNGGYKVESVTPIDQFLHSVHTESVVVLKKGSGEL